MTTRRPTFRIMKNGYDRFAVDDVMEQYAAQVAFLQRKLELYQEQMVETTEKLEDLQTRFIRCAFHIAGSIATVY